MREFLSKKLSNQWIGFSLICIIFSLTIWISNKIVKQLKVVEKSKIENYAKSLELISQNEFIDPKTQDFLFKLIEDNQTIPVILIDEQNNISFTKNIDPTIENDTKKLKKFVDKLKNENMHIEIDLPDGKNHVYYSNSNLLNQLRYYPVILILLCGLFILFSYLYFKSIRDTEKSYLWAGMAKETAHQIGTPLSSLMGWVELLKLEEIDQTPILEIEKDVNRLKHIAERFSKIGSEAELDNHNLVDITKTTLTYLRQRISKGIELNFETQLEEITTKMNPLLYSWVIENLIKNAADAMQNKGVLDVSINTIGRNIEICVSDTGPGIPQKLQKKIFEPGFTTKKRGWGLGLSLAKRIIENYHNGKIFVFESSKEKGTIFKIILKR
ncbi:sensor histidine kinase [Faecalibacter macacae]|uniref:histidine kinase n=1 Tax=Faecalibacter macacae TaxID=1859289 RepID=A0A3L9M259_9FLAO|nr:HAMP domain-containing sensor histidine kinase [Faecalibacter macacae]RLZ06998.1 sensor histidine kinase [Faecalibacter macacae]